MFDIGWSELLVIGVVLIVVVGPKDLPRMLRTFGKTMTQLRRMAGDFRKQFDEALTEAMAIVPDDDAPDEVAGAPGAPGQPVPASDPLFGSDHDGHTQVGVDAGEFARQQPGIPGQPQAPSVTRPVASLLISNGETVDVDRVVIIGRAPEARRFTSTEAPLLVTVPSPLQEISSTHLEVRPGSGADHGSAVVTDLGSTNGTQLVQPGLEPEDLTAGIAVQLIPGAIINLGDGVTIQVTRP